MRLGFWSAGLSLVACLSACATSGEPPTAQRSVWEWTQAGDEVGGGTPGVPDADRRHLFTGDNRPRVIDRASEQSVLTLSPPAGLSIGSVTVDSPWLVWTVQGEGLPIRTWGVVDNLDTGVRRTFRPPLSEMGLVEVVDGLVTYSTLDRRARNCIASWRLGSSQVAVSACRPAPEQHLELVQSRSGAAVTSAHPRGRRDCRTLRITRNPGSSDPVWRPVRLHRQCTAVTGVVAPGFVAWDERRDRLPPDEAVLYARPTGEPVRPLGRGAAATLESCGRWVYWKAYAESGEAEEIRRWRPGSGTETIYWTPSDTTVTGPACHGEAISVVEAFIGSGPYRERLLEGHPPT